MLSTFDTYDFAKSLLSRRQWKHVQPPSDTDDTGSSDDTGGDGYFSHGTTSLSHQHWKDQIISAGSFNLHDTEAAEAAHKTSMSLASRRVRHLSNAKTISNMLHYLCYHTTFEQLKLLVPALNNQVKSRSPVTKPGVKLPLREVVSGVGSFEVEMGEDLEAVDTQKRFLHSEVRVARVEMMDLVCDKLGISKSRRSYAALGNLKWSFGQVRLKNVIHTLLIQ